MDETKCAGCCAHKPDYCFRCFDGVVEARDAARAGAARCADDFNFQSSELAELRDALIEVARVYRAASRDRYCDDDWCTKCFGDEEHEAGCPVGDALAALPLEVRAAIEAGERVEGE